MIWATILSALWLGILTAISPCPLATNIAAISFIGRKSDEKNHVIASGILYALGRIIVYVALGVIITAGAQESAELSRFLQRYMNEALGPILIILGLTLLGWIGSRVSLQLGSAKLQERAKTGGIIWALPIGILFALSFCPVSAGLFFGALITLAINQQSVLVVPISYGIGTAIPVIFFAIVMVFFSSYLGKMFDRLTQIERWLRYSVGIIFILVGIYYSLVYIY